MRILAREQLGARCVRMDVSDCKELTKAQISAAIAACPSLQELTALRVGPGSWSAKHIRALLSSATTSLTSVRVDMLLEMKNDLHDGSPLLQALSNPILRVEKLTLISDNVTRASNPAVAATCGAADAAAAATLAAAAAVEASTSSMAAVDIGDESSAGNCAVEDEAEAADPAGTSAEGVWRLRKALLREEDNGSVYGSADCVRTGAPWRLVESLVELDASSGALDVTGAASQLLAPLLSAPGCALASLSVCHMSRAGLRVLSRALSLNSSLRTLCLSSNMILSGACAQLAAALRDHASLTRLDLDHNPILDAGGSALAAMLAVTRISSISLCFTGVADGTCGALARALGTEACRLRSVNLSGNRITSAGVAALSASLGKLRTLDLTANVGMDADGATAIAKALPSSALRSLRLAGCKVDKKACSRLAAALISSNLSSLDVSSNHFGNGGSDEFAWVLGECEALLELNLADCNLEDEGADELLEALTDEDARPALRRLDLRWNKLGAPKHQAGRGISADPRVDASSQKQQTAADRQTAYLEQTFQQAKAAGKKVYVPKWAREQQKMAKAAGGSGGTGSAMG